MSTSHLEQRLQDLLNHIRQGKIIEAMNEFYDTDTVMQDNANPPTKGLAANIERENQFMSGVKEWKGFDVTASGVGDNVTFYEATTDLITTNEQNIHLEQVSVAKWKNGKIVSERFYHAGDQESGKVAWDRELRKAMGLKPNQQYVIFDGPVQHGGPGTRYISNDGTSTDHIGKAAKFLTPSDAFSFAHKKNILLNALHRVAIVDVTDFELNR